MFTLSKALMAGLTYPYDWELSPTLADDGDPLDGFVIHDGATYPGTVLRSAAPRRLSRRWLAQQRAVFRTT
ncbi:hypothetical protein [Bradyrhizobium sp. USDA 372]